ncbi:MAG: methylated-DNA--[protein]-cysteine S-methyltransferase [Bdellovibrionota bacterium]
MQLFYTHWQSPIGKIHLVSDEKSLRYLIFDKNWKELKRKLTDLEEKETPVLKQAIRELKKYFQGGVHQFNVPVSFEGTEFQKKTWNALRKIPYGKTISYGEQATRIGSPMAVRAVGATNGKNPISIIIPCHRVIGKSGHLTGYGGGIGIKQRLLELEGIL